MIPVSIIIPTHNRRVLVLALLESLANEACPSSDQEVIVVDDGSTDGTTAAIVARYPDVRVLSLPATQGPSHGRNAGARVARGELLLFLDGDGEVTAGWLKAMVQRHTGSTVLLGNVVDFHGDRVQSLPRRSTFIGKSVRCGPERANTGPSCNLGIPRTAFEALGGFDEELPYYFEDSDLCIRARRAGYTFRFVPDAVFRHYGSEKKSGAAILMQEHNSTYGMLKYYEGDRPRLIAFTLMNGYWMVARLMVWLLCGRLTDGFRLLRGWASAHSRFVKRRP